MPSHPVRFGSSYFARAGQAWRDTFHLYHAEDADSASIRAQHLDYVLRLTPAMMAANLINAALVSAALGFAGRPLLIVWVVLIGLIVATALRSWWRRRKMPRSLASRRAMRHSTWHAGLLGLLWAAVPAMWFASAPAEVRLLIATLTTGMLSAGAFAMGRLPGAALAYLATIVSGSLVGLWAHGGALAAPVSGLLLVYAAICALGAMAAGRQATALLIAQRDATRQQELVSMLLHDFEEHAAEGLWETDAQGRLRYASARTSELFACEPKALHGQVLLQLLGDRSPSHRQALSNAFDRGRPFRNLTIELTGSDGAGWWMLSAKPVAPVNVGDGGWRGVIVDVTDEVSAQDRMRHMAHFDALTGLANRVTLHAHLAQVLSQGERAALMAIDVDHFKSVNDTHGHSVGDALLKAVALRLRTCVRPQDLVARLGGDEFAVLIQTDTTRNGIHALSQRLSEAFAPPCDLGALTLQASVSMGVALTPDHGQAIDELMGNADLALYQAKASGRAQAALYDAQLGETSRRQSAISEALRTAEAEGQLHLHVQPKLAVASGRVVGVEALLRWQHPVLGSVSPAEFVPIAERTGSIGHIGAWVLREACRLAGTQLQGLTIAVNVSPAQLRSAAFEDDVRQALLASGLPPERLELEITESLFIDDAASAVQRLTALRRLGVRIALDDFGAGYSSLGYLRQFSFDVLKIDRQFIGELMTRDDARAIVGTIVQLARRLGMRTVAEGVETEDQLRLLVSLGCDELQGYLLARPAPIAQMRAMVAQAEGLLLTR
ncbi:EAL domain-containing protein [Ideonella sp. DXS29W]|uniref:EAL domain-containing protein n=1 Tax=Ideonella lacteola TaxID=2984193 RepID=A0ABU9BVW1_9BURK